ncbi:hypothetical protein GC176_02100 [bacterium]|nr:hypothetical protein [bacterium]
MKRLMIASAAVFAVAAITILTGVPQHVAAQSGSRAGSGTRTYTQGSGARTVQQDNRPFEAKFWDYLVSAKYMNWAPVPGQTDDATPGNSPHGAFLKMYLNRTAAGRPKELPNGSIVVKENYGPDGKALMAITVMYRSKGFNPQGGDWYWIKYNPNGTVAASPPEMGSMPLAGKPMGCIKCHGEGAAGNDFAFLNDGM